MLRFREKHTPETECVPSQRVGVAAKCGMVGFYRLVFKISHKAIAEVKTDMSHIYCTL